MDSAAEYGGRYRGIHNMPHIWLGSREVCEQSPKWYAIEDGQGG